MDNSKFETILTEFGIKPPFTILPSASGLINKTFLVECGQDEFVLQELHHIVKPETCEDAKAVCDYVRARGISVPEFILSKEGKPCLKEESQLWRLMKRLPGISIDTITSPKQAYTAGRLMGQFHSSLVNFNYKCQGSIPHFHDTPYIFEQFKKTASLPQYAELRRSVSEDVNIVLNEIPRQLLPSGLHRQIVHGDLKISNFLFRGDEAASLLDFDTCMTHSPLIDIGDALRSWCNQSGEDSETAKFNKDIYTAARMGYTETAALNDKERSLIPQAFRLLVIEQAMRFLKDYFEDNYYGWNAEKFKSRREHNLVRTRGQLSLFAQIKGL